MDLGLKGKKAIVTGGTRGIGAPSPRALRGKASTSRSAPGLSQVSLRPFRP